MSDFVYDNRFLSVGGTVIDGGDFHDLFVDLQTHIATKADVDGQTYSGLHTFVDLTVTGDAIFSGTFDATGVATALFAAISGTNITASGALVGATVAGAADTTDITGGTWS